MPAIPPQHPEPAEILAALVERKVYVCKKCGGIYADAPVTECDCEVGGVQAFHEGTLTYRVLPDDGTLKVGSSKEAELRARVKELDDALANLLVVAEDMHMQINEARQWKSKPLADERANWARQIDQCRTIHDPNWR